MNMIQQNIQNAGFDTSDHLVCSRQVNDAYGSSLMSRKVSEELMHEMFGAVVSTDHDKAANIALRYMISEFVRNLVNGQSTDVNDIVSIADRKTKQFFLNQPWFVPGAHSSIQDIPTAIEEVDVAVEDIKIERTKVGHVTVKPKKGLKQEAAKRIFDANPGAVNAVIIGLFMKQLDMSKAGATTYLFNLRKKQRTLEE